MEIDKNQQPQKDTKKIYILLTVILLLIATNVFLWLQKDKAEVKVEQTNTEKSRLQDQLNQLEIELNEATANADSLNESLLAKDEELKNKVAQLQNALRRGSLTANELENARNEIDQLRYYIKKYQTEIFELKKENELLASENTDLKKSVVAEQQKSSSLLNENIGLSNKVAVASLLRTSSIQAKGIRLRSSGKEVETDREKVLEKIRVDFIIADNPVASQGARDFYLRIINPDGKVLVVTDATDSKFRADGEDLQYSAKLNANFENKAGQAYSIYWNKSSTLKDGTYKIILYADGNSIGETKLAIK